MNAKYWLFAAALASTACLPTDDKDEDEEEEEESQPSDEPGSEPSEPGSEPSEPAGEPSYAYITQSYSGDAVVTPGTGYEGTESLSLGVNDSAGTGNLSTELVWSVSGTSTEAPSECGDCVFAFDVQLTFDAAASTDPDGSGSDMAFGYALGTGDYGTTLFYGGESGWGAWLADGQTQADLAGTEHAQVVDFSDGTNFTYTDGIVDFYYYY